MAGMLKFLEIWKAETLPLQRAFWAKMYASEASQPVWPFDVPVPSHSTGGGRAGGGGSAGGPADFVGVAVGGTAGITVAKGAYLRQRQIGGGKPGRMVDSEPTPRAGNVSIGAGGDMRLVAGDGTIWGLDLSSGRWVQEVKE